MTLAYIHHRVTVTPLQWQALADAIRGTGAGALAAEGAALYGIWRSQIGRPRDELTVMTVWPGDGASAARAEAILFGDMAAVRACRSERMVPTLRPEGPEPPRRQGNYAFRWFETPPENWDEFLDLCAGAWPGFESSYDSQVIGLWRGPDRDDGSRRSLLMTRRPDLAMWERSKIPQGPEEVEVRRKLSRRYDLCTWTVVYTSTLLTADDREDTERWT
ncbi:MAG: hypothetical protein OEU46_04110 [Alphaproteobacteria bacterium]|nr:hypothetical protein [Alphaproteobacteria bacterium]